MDIEKSFRKLNDTDKLKALKEKGAYVGSRMYSAYHIHLYVYEGFFVEIWYKLGLNLIQWIDIQKNDDILQQYTDKIDIYRDLNINPTSDTTS